MELLNNFPSVPATIFGPTRTKLVLPAFSYPVSWLGVSTMLARYAVNNTREFSIKRPIEHPDGSFVLAASYTDGTFVYRFKLADLADTLNFPVYDGEKLGLNAYIEVWSTEDATATMGDDFTLESSILNEPSDTRVTCTSSDTVVALVETPFTEIPVDHACNPFCTPLCV